MVAVTTAAVWAIVFALINPRGEFPMMDDWIYHRIVAIWISEGRLALPEVTQMVVLGHIALGVAIGRVAGLSFEALRLAMLVVGWAGIVAVYAACRALGGTSGIAALAAAAMLVNPVYLTMSATFMTDLPFFVLSTAALIAYVRALREPCWSAVLAGTVLSAAAATIRQPALILPVAFMVATALRHRLDRRTLVLALAPFAVVAALLAALPALLDAAGLLPRDYNLPMRELTRNLRAPSAEWLTFAAKRSLNIGFHLGWFVLPFALLAGGWTRRRLLTAALIAATIAVAVLATGKVAPWGSSLLYDFGIGSVSLHDVTVLGLPHLPRAPWLFWLVLTVSSGAAVATLASQWGATIADAPDRDARAVSAFALLAVAGYTVPLALSWFYDRYLLPVVPCLMAYAALRQGTIVTPRRVAAFLAVMLPLAVGAVALAHDYFAWNRARWDGLTFLLERATVQEIDGGYEFAGMARYADGTAWQKPADLRFMVAFGEVPGYREIRRYEYSAWLPRRSGAILVLERQAVR
jgi:hypothetical protein